MLLGACTINPPKAEDIDRLLHARALIRKLFSSESLLRLVAVLFSGQENISPFKDQAGAQGLKMLNSRQLTVLRKLVEKGEEERFVRFLESPSNTELSERSQWEAE